MKTTSRFLFTVALLSITLVFVVGCKSVTPVNNGIIAPFTPDEIEAAYEAGRDGDWERVCDMLQAQPGLAKVCFRKHERYTLLHFAAKDGNVEAVRSLIAKGADVNAQIMCGETPLHEAVNDDNIKLVEMLIKCGAKVNAIDDNGDTPLDLPISDEVRELLKKHGAKTSDELKEKTTDKGK